MAITIGELIKNNAVDGSFNPLPNIDIAYGPYTSTTAALAAIPTASRSIGLTVGIKSGNTINEYWFNGGTGAANLVQKGGGGSGSGVNFQVDSEVTDTTTYLESQFPGAPIPTFVIDGQLGGVYIKYAAESWLKTEGTILTSALPSIAKVTGANVLSFK